MEQAMRFNEGKPKYEYLPILQLANQITDYYDYVEGMSELLFELAEFQCSNNSNSKSYTAIKMAYLRLGNLEEVLKLECDVFEFGAKKYAKWNWIKGMPYSKVLASAVRHIVAILKAGDINAIDEESGIEHRGHIACNLRMLMFYLEYKKEYDDRPDSELFE